ncbi:MAG: BatA domain-containing protein, partial [Gemmataceae bacterium]
MPFGFLIPLLLAGLAGLAIPPLIHLLNRRRYQVVDWGAMQFLQISETTRRRLLIEELLLMALRMGLIGVMVLALAGPFVQMAWFNQLLGQVGVRPNRDVVIVVDGSYSMGYEGEGSSAQEKAKDWIKNFVDDLTPGDTVAVLQAKEVVVPVLAEPSGDFDQVRHVIDRLPAPAGGVDWPQAVHAAWQLLDAKSQRTRRDIIVLSDGQRFGWADGHSLLRWELLAQPLRQNGDLPPPQLFVFNLEPKRPAEPPNWSLAPLTVSRTVAAAGQDIRFRTALRLSGQKAYRPPFRVRLEIDGKPARDLQPPQTAQLEKGQVPLTFHQEFATPGSHLVSVIVEPDPPKEQRSKDYVVKDRLPGDNRQDFALEVVRALPVLLVDGDPKPNAKLRGTDFLRDALSPKIDPKPRVLAQVVPIQELNEAALSQPLRPDQPDTRPRVLILVNVERLSARQNQAIEQFLADGGGVLVALGERCDASAYNDLLYRGGQGWLPARLEEAVGDVDAPEKAASPLQETLFHPALDLFREMK